MTFTLKLTIYTLASIILCLLFTIYTMAPAIADMQHITKILQNDDWWKMVTIITVILMVSDYLLPPTRAYNPMSANAVANEKQDHPLTTK